MIRNYGVDSALWKGFHPRSVAVVGASQDPTKRGHQVVKALLDRGFAGKVHPVHPAGGTLLGLPVARSVEEVGGSPELAVICTPAATVPSVVRSCGLAGVSVAVVLAGGFKERGPEGARLEEELRDVAKDTGVRVLGPNTSGFLNLKHGLDVIGIPQARRGGLGLLAQSGNTILGLLNDAAETPGCGFSLVMGVGNEADVSFHECLEVLGRDPDTRAILIHAESITQGRPFLESARRISRRKPLVALKGGRSRTGSQAARSHTGAVSTDHATVKAALRQAGIVEVRRSDDLLPVGRTLATQPPAKAGEGFAILADGGGHGTLASDTLEELDVPLSQLSPEIQRRLRALLGDGAAVGNPVDLAGAADRDPGVFPRVMDLLLSESAVSGVVMVGLFGGYAIRFASELARSESRAARILVAAGRAANKPLVLHSIYAASGSAPVQILEEEGVPVFRSVEVACRAAAATWERGRILSELARRPAGLRFRGGASRQGEASSLPGESAESALWGRSGVEPEPVVMARRDGRVALLEPEVRSLLSRWGVPMVPATLCESWTEVRAAARLLGNPATLKVVSGTILHKTDAGGVELGLSGARAVRRGYERILESVARFARERDLDPDIRGVLVSPTFSRPDVELLAGVRMDRVFGPVLTVGAGGTAVEVLQDVALRVLPVEEEEVLEMLAQLRISPMLHGFRGRAPVDISGLASLLMAVARCALEVPGLQELELNPVFVSPSGVCAVDARAFLAPEPAGALVSPPSGALPSRA